MQNEIYRKLLNNKPVKRPGWDGYWKLNPDGDSILMYCKDGQILDIRSTKRVIYTFDNILANDWVEATHENCPLLGGDAYIDFPKALQYLFRGIPIYCAKGDVGFYCTDNTIYTFKRSGDNQYSVIHASSCFEVDFNNSFYSDMKFILLESIQLKK